MVEQHGARAVRRGLAVNMSTVASMSVVCIFALHTQSVHAKCVPKKRALVAVAATAVAPAPNTPAAPPSSMRAPPTEARRLSWPSEPPTEAHLAELRGAGPESFRTNRVPVGASDRYGHAETLIHAPAAAVLARAKDYAHYRELAPRRFRAASVLEMTPTSTDVYLEVPMVGGLVVLWEVLRFAPVATLSKTTKRVEGIFVRGNVSSAHVVFDVIQLGPKETLLVADLLITLPFAAPEDKIDEELRDAAADALRGIRESVETKP